MSMRGHKELCSLSLLLLLLWPAVPAGSQEVVVTERGYDLQLENTLAGKEYSFQLDGSAESDTVQAIRVSDLRLTFRNVWELQEQEVQATPAARAEPKKKRKAGRWLKKHWYVPVLVGLVLGGVLLDDDDGDDDSED